MRFRSSAGRLLKPVLTSGILGKSTLTGLVGDFGFASAVTAAFAFDAVATCIVAGVAARPRRDARSRWILKGPL